MLILSVGEGGFDGMEPDGEPIFCLPSCSSAGKSYLLWFSFPGETVAEREPGFWLLCLVRKSELLVSSISGVEHDTVDSELKLSAVLPLLSKGLLAFFR